MNSPQASHDKRTRPPGWLRNCFQMLSEKSTQASDQNGKHLLGSEVSWCDYRLAQTPKEAFSEVRVHAGTTQVDFEVDRPWSAASPPGDHLITMVKETVKEGFEKWKKVKPVRISQWSDSDENAIDCEVACDCVKCANVVVGLRLRLRNFGNFPLRNFGNFCKDTRLPTSWHLLSALKWPWWLTDTW